ncbi:MAG: glycosyl hydrolase-related protein, partial [Verrucomicrobiota bacterium]
GKLPEQGSFLSIDTPEVVVTAVKKAHEGNAVIVRLFNPTSGMVRSTLSCGFDSKSVELVNMLEQPGSRSQRIEQQGRNIGFDIGAKKIQTLRIEIYDR